MYQFNIYFLRGTVEYIILETVFSTFDEIAGLYRLGLKLPAQK